LDKVIQKNLVIAGLTRNLFKNAPLYQEIAGQARNDRDFRNSLILNFES